MCEVCCTKLSEAKVYEPTFSMVACFDLIPRSNLVAIENDQLVEATSCDHSVTIAFLVTCYVRAELIFNGFPVRCLVQRSSMVRMIESMFN